MFGSGYYRCPDILKRSERLDLFLRRLDVRFARDYLVGDAVVAKEKCHLRRPAVADSRTIEAEDVEHGVARALLLNLARFEYVGRATFARSHTVANLGREIAESHVFPR